MNKYQVLLIQRAPLLGDGLRRIFQARDDIELVMLDGNDPTQMVGSLEHVRADMIILAGEKEDDAAVHLISDLLKQYDEVPVVWVDLETNILRVYRSHILGANIRELLNTIRAGERSKMAKNTPNR